MDEVAEASQLMKHATVQHALPPKREQAARANASTPR
jgi:hypothetical protein